jgi:surface protein
MFGFNSISQKSMEDRLVLTISSSTGDFIWSEVSVDDYDFEWHEVSNSSNKGQGTITSTNTPISFGSPGTYQLKISPNIPNSYTPNHYQSVYRNEILSIDNWGSHPFSKDLDNGFIRCSNLDIKASDCPNFSLATVGSGRLNGMFQECKNLKNENGSLGNWDMSKFENLTNFLSVCENLKEDIDISSWDTSNVTSFSYLFQACPINSDIPTDIKINHGKTYIAWDTSNVTSFRNLNNGVLRAELDSNGNSVSVVKGGNIGNINNWDTSKATIMSKAFSGPVNVSYSSSFNQDISTKPVTIGAGTSLEKTYNAWDVSKVTNFGYNNFYDGIFFNSAFNQDIGNWEINTGSNVTMTGMFSGTKFFNQPIHQKTVTVGSKTYEAWNTKKVTNFSYMFYNYKYQKHPMPFNQDIGNWDVSNNETFLGMFMYNPTFNQDLSKWDTSKVTNMGSMFNGSGITYSLSSSYQNDPQRGEYIAWDTGNVTNMSLMFNRSLQSSHPYDNNINNWDTSKVTKLQGMFAGNGIHTSSFNQDISTKLTIIGAGTPVEKTYNAWDVSKVTDFGSNLFYEHQGHYTYGTFYNNQHFNQDIGNWEINTTDDVAMRYMFSNSVFNQPIHQKTVNVGSKTYEAWNTKKVVNLLGTFQSSNFNQDIGNWNISSSKTLERTFYNANSFNQDLQNWDTSNVTNMSNTFCGVPLSSYPLKTKQVTQHGYTYNAWDTSKVTSMNFTFNLMYNSDSSYLGYDGDITNWNTSNVTNMRGMFGGVLNQPHQFNQDISTKEATVGGIKYIAWDVSKVEQFGVNTLPATSNHFSYGMFGYNNKFNQPIGNWEINTGSAVTMKCMFNNSIFNQNISSSIQQVGTGTNLKTYEAWNTEKVINFVNMFSHSTFNQPIGNWDMISASSTSQMFLLNPLFNQDINTSIQTLGTRTYNAWYTPNLTNINSMFYYSSGFDQSLDKWYVGNVTNGNSSFYNTNLSNKSFASQNISLHGGVNYDSWKFNTTSSLYGLFDRSSNFEGIGLDTWDLTNLAIGKPSSPNFLRGTSLSTNTYDNILTSWEAQSPTVHPDHSDTSPVNINFGLTSLTPGSAAETAKLSLQNNYGWVITHTS